MSTLIARDETRNTQTRWAIELYPYSTPYPSTTDTTAPSPVSIVTADKDKESFAVDIQQSITAGPPSPAAIQASMNLLNGGLKGITVSRTKARVDAQCTFQIQGMVPRGAFPGTWVLITSIRTDGAGREQKLIRFIGQIYDMYPEEIVVGNGTVVTITTYHVREWSAALKTPVRYDLFAIVNTLPQEQSVAAVANLLSAKVQLSIEDYQNLGEKTFNPFELAQLILRLVGSLNADDAIGTLSDTQNIQLSEVATRMPSVPPTLLKRLGLSSVSSSNPFNTGFVNVLTGVQVGSLHNDGTWNGIFTNISDEYSTVLLQSPPDRPITVGGITALMANGESAWALISKYCDPALNEFYTDILYEYKDDGVSIRAKPVIVIRDHPFLMRNAKNALASKASLDSWTIYDDLPRLRLDSTYITKFSRSNTFMNSPNYYRTNFVPVGSARDGIATALAQTLGTQRLEPEGKRFGGQEHFIETSFLSQDVIKGGASKFDPFWFKKVLYVSMAWHCQNYRMLDGNITLKDDNFPISIGTNVQFTWGNQGQWEIVGHVEGVQISFKIDDKGLYSTDTNVQLTRIVQQDPNEDNLTFIPPAAMANLYYTEQGAPPDDDSSSIFAPSLGSGSFDVSVDALTNPLGL